jgi:hypothetical protein
VAKFEKLALETGKKMVNGYSQGWGATLGTTQDDPRTA